MPASARKPKKKTVPSASPRLIEPMPAAIKAAAAPAPIPMSTRFIITSCPAPLERLEAACAPPQPSASGMTPGASLSFYSSTRPHGAAAKVALLDHVRQQAEEARALDRLREFAL